MKTWIKVIAIAAFIASSGAAVAQNANAGATKPDHHDKNRRSSHSSAMPTGDPNGTAGGPTTLSGTGPSTYGGNNPGAAR